MSNSATPPTQIVRTPAAVGRTVTLLLVPGSSRARLGPAWAVLCGACASGAWPWQDAKRLIALLLAILISETLWSTWRALLIDLDWQTAWTHSLDSPSQPDQFLSLPYTTPWSPLGRLLIKLQRAARILNSETPPEVRGAVFTAPLLPALALLLSAVVGWEMTVLSLAALALSLIEWRMERKGRTHTALQAGQQFGLSWLAGHLAFAPLTTSSFALACCYAIAYQGALVLEQACPLADAPKSRQDNALAWPLGLLFGGQAAALALMVVLKYPIRAAAVGLALAPQILLLPQLRRGERAVWYLRRTIPFLILAIPIAAWAV